MPWWREFERLADSGADWADVRRAADLKAADIAAERGMDPAGRCPGADLEGCGREGRVVADPFALQLDTRIEPVILCKQCVWSRCQQF